MSPWTNILIEGLYYVYLLVLLYYLVIGLASCFTSKISPERGLNAGVLIIILGLFLVPITNMVVNLTS